MNVQILASAWMAFVKIIAVDINVCAIQDSWPQRTWRTVLVSIAVREMFRRYINKGIVIWEPQAHLCIVVADRIAEWLERCTWLDCFVFSLLLTTRDCRMMHEWRHKVPINSHVTAAVVSQYTWVQICSYACKWGTFLTPVSWILTLLCSVWMFAGNVRFW